MSSAEGEGLAPSSEADEFNRDEDVLVASSLMKVVGCRYYTGVLHKGEFAFLVREPHNPYDPNAIAVKNHVDNQVGHIAASLAKSLAPIMDDDRPIAPRIDAEVLKPNLSSVNIRVNFWAPEALRERTLKRLRRNGVDLESRSDAEQAGASSGGRDSSSGGEGGGIVSTVDGCAMHKNSQKALQDLFDRLSNQPKLDLSVCRSSLAGKLKTVLLPHQEEGIAWMMHLERSGQRLPFWKEITENGKSVFFNEITRTSYPDDPGPPCGGILADDMGLGKTIQTLSLVVAEIASGRASLQADEQQGAAKNSKKSKKGKDPAHMQSLDSASGGEVERATLIVCPASVMANWREQAAMHVSDSCALKVLVHHGKSKEDEAGLSRFDIVVTSYSTLAAELDTKDKDAGDDSKQGGKRKRERHSPSSAVLSKFHWHRVVLDEAHTIRNRQTKAAQAVFALNAKYRWALTGTPIVNGAEDLGSLFEFLRVKPLHHINIFRQAISRPLRLQRVSQEQSGMFRLRALMRVLCLRRGKDILSDSLPAQSISIQKLDLGPVAEAYDSLFESAAAGFEALLAVGGQEVMHNYSSVLECILRLRQVCDAIELVPPARLQRAREIFAEINKRKGKSGEPVPLTPQEAQDLFERLKGALSSFKLDGTVEERHERHAPQEPGGDGVGTFECSVCLDDLEEHMVRILRVCKHTFCSSCLDQIVSLRHGGKIKCPMCRKEFGNQDVLQASDLQLVDSSCHAENSSSKIEPEVPPGSDHVQSPKIRALIHTLQKEWASDPQQKAVIFSQFTSMLDLISVALEAVFGPLCCARLDGSMTPESRAAQVSRFTADSHGAPRILLCSLKACGVGINLCRANLVYMMDIWWNYAAEQQAMDRVYRIGQTRDVKVVRFICASSIEERILELQESKTLLGLAALNQLSPEQLRQARVSDLQKIFQRQAR